MAPEGPKTRPTGASVPAFLAAVPDARRVDCRRLVTMMRRATGAAPKLWGTAIVGFGAYRQSYADGRVSDWPIIAFSPRKADLTLYLMPGMTALAPLLARLGRHRRSKACLHLKALADVDLSVLEELIQRAVAAMDDRRVDRPARDPRRTRAVHR